MAALRFLFAGAVLYAICVVRGRARPARADVVRACVTGFSLLLLGNGATAWTVQYLPTGMNSLLLSLSPVWMALIAFAWGGERPTRAGVAGMVLGFAGLALLLQPKASTALPWWPVVVCLLSSVSWAFGSIYQRRSSPPASVALSTALQMLAGGVMLAIEALAFGQWQHLDVHAVTASSWAALAYLAVFGSLAAYSAYVYTMQAASTALASTYAYVNPIVAVAIGMLLFHERFTPVEAAAGAIIIAGVALMMLPRRRMTA
jgi:drug/metabolite transporter (DMT)-like permease